MSFHQKKTNKEIIMKQLEAINNSYELFKLINQHRVAVGKKPMKDHYELVRKIKDEIGEDLQARKKIGLFYAGSNGAKMPFEAYELTREDVYLVSMRESKQVRKSVYRYLEECEASMHLMYAILTQKGYLPQELGAQTAGIECPRLFMKYIKKRDYVLEDFINRNFLVYKRVGKKSTDLAWRWTQAGYQYILRNKDNLNKRVQELHTQEKNGELQF